MATTAVKANPRTASANGTKETVKIEIVTPRIAQRWLEGNVDNRKLREDRVMNLSRTLQEGDWELTGDAIVFDDQGVLINGQHRLTAIVVTEIPARLVILRGVPSKSQEVMDTGLARNLADQLHRRGLGYTVILAGAIRNYHQILYNEATGNVHYADQSVRPTLRQLLALYEHNQEMAELSGQTSRLVNHIRVRPGPTVAMWYRLRQIDRTEADLFMELLTTGEGLRVSDPIYKLREWCLQDARFRTTKGRAPVYRYMAYFFKAWNMWREGKKVQHHITWHFTPTKREPWPIPQ